MKRALLYFLKLGLLVAAAVWLANRPGTVAVEWQGYAVETSVGIAALALVVALVAASWLYLLWRALLRSPRAIGRIRGESRRVRGYRALTQGMVAVAAGDARTAERCAAKASSLLDEPPLTLLLSAQAAQLNGDEQAAAKYFEAMLQRPETEFLGLRGLLTQALRRGDRARALELARRAQALEPKAEWPLLTLVELEARRGDWTAAEEALDRAQRAKALPPERAKHQRTALLAERARAAGAAGRLDEAVAAAQKAHDLTPSSVPAAVELARHKARAGNVKAARKALEQAWRAGPHPDLADAWGEIEEGADPLALVKRYEALVAIDPEAQEGHLALARAAIRARLWGQARTHLERVRKAAPTARVYLLMAELEEAEHGDGPGVRQWLAKVPGADADATWVCAGCGGPATAWSAVCGHCGTFDALEWRTPGTPVPGLTGAQPLGPVAAATALPTIVPFAPPLPPGAPGTA
ncbi:MAG TPA: heme biosynthesis HemY N-terminal domain-containing protein [Azospirillaceae bacterium]|nr:heme biosynthesis HemY N-terminal domain-containing protein [Azospirillaceae bacterium]